MRKYHVQGNQETEKLILASCSRARRVHRGGGDMVTSSRHGYRNRKPRAHILNHKHKAESEERTYNVKSLSSQNPPLVTHLLSVLQKLTLTGTRYPDARLWGTSHLKYHDMPPYFHTCKLICGQTQPFSKVGRQSRVL